MRVVLVAPPPHQRADQYDERDFPRLALACLAVELRARAPEARVAVMDAKLERLGYPEVRTRVRTFGPDVVGVTAMTNESEPAPRVARDVKRLSPAIVTVLACGASSRPSERVACSPGHVDAHASCSRGTPPAPGARAAQAGPNGERQHGRADGIGGKSSAMPAGPDDWSPSLSAMLVAPAGTAREIADLVAALAATARLEVTDAELCVNLAPLRQAHCARTIAARCPRAAARAMVPGVHPSRRRGPASMTAGR